MPFVGPAAGLPFLSLLARFPYRIALAAWTTLLVASFVVVLVCALRIARAPRDPLVYAGAAAFAIASAPMIGAFALGQAALLAAAGLAGALVCYRARNATAAILATLLAAVQPNLALALVGRLRSRRDLIIAGSAGAMFLGLTLLSGGPAGIVAYLHRLEAHAAAERFTTIQHTPAAIAFAFGATPASAIALGGIIAFIALGSTLAAIVRERLDATTSTLVCCAALPLAIPFFHEHDFVIEVLPLLVLAVRSSGRARALAAVAAALILVDWLGLAQRHFAHGQIVCLGFAVSFAFVALAGIRVRGLAQYAGVATLALLAAILVPVSYAHPAPTWPDTLPAAFRAVAGADASSVWGAEQRAAGLIAAEPVWGALRSLPLAGCIVLGAALIIDARSRRRKPRPAHDVPGVAAAALPV